MSMLVTDCALVAVKRGRRLLTGLNEDLHIGVYVWCVVVVVVCMWFAACALGVG